VTSRAAPISEPGAQSARPARRLNLSFVGVLPFFLFAILALLIPIGFLIIGSFQDTNHGDALTLKNYSDLVTDSSIINAYGTSIEISVVTAIAGAVFGFLLAYAVILGGLPGFLRTALMTFSGVASNFAGVPLALAFIFTLGALGLVTGWLKALGLNIYAGGFNLLTKTGLELVYMYFQFPLMVLIIAPAIDGLKKEWREASENMGASPRQYWQYVALPILLPSILGSTILLFGNSIGAQATAYQLTGGTLPLVTVLIGAQISGDVLHNDGLGYALAMGLVFIMGIAIIAYSILQRRSERWLRR
jgi:putative spermidine/putrescine transport system permease protein